MMSTAFSTSPPHSNGEVARGAGGVILSGAAPLTPPSSYDDDTSPFEWGGN